MILSEKDSNLIDQYLMRKLKGEELQNFHLRMETDNEFAEEVKLMTSIVKGIRKAGRKDLKSQINAIISEGASVEKKKINLFKIISIAASAIILIGIGYLLVSQNSKNTSNLAIRINKTAQPLKTVEIPSETYSLTQSVKLINLENGGKLFIPDGIFINEQGNTLKNVSLNYKNLNDAVDQFLAGIPTSYDSGKDIELLKPEAMLAISVKSTKTIQFNEAVPLQVILPTIDTIQSNSIFKLDTINKTWIACGRDILIDPSKYKLLENTADILIPKLEDTTKPRFKIVVKNEQFPELAYYKNFIFEIAPEEKDFDPNDDQQIWKNIVVQKGEKGKPYKVTFKNDFKTVTYLVNPVFSKENYAEAFKIYKREIKVLETQKYKGEELKKYELAKLISKNGYHGYFRVFGITSQGIYTNSSFATIKNNLDFDLKFTDKYGNFLNITQIAVVDFSKNTLQRYIPGQSIKLQLDNTVEKAILAITIDNRFAYLTGQEFTNTFNRKKLKEVKLNVSDSPDNYNHLKSLFQPSEFTIIENFIKPGKKSYF